MIIIVSEANWTGDYDNVVQSFALQPVDEFKGIRDLLHIDDEVEDDSLSQTSTSPPSRRPWWIEKWWNLYESGDPVVEKSAEELADMRALTERLRSLRLQHGLAEEWMQEEMDISDVISEEESALKTPVSFRGRELQLAFFLAEFECLYFLIYNIIYNCDHIMCFIGTARITYRFSNFPKYSVTFISSLPFKKSINHDLICIHRIGHSFRQKVDKENIHIFHQLYFVLLKFIKLI